MANDSDVTITLRAELKGYEKALKDAVRQTERAAKAAEKALANIGKGGGGGRGFAAINDNFAKSAGQIANDARVMQFQLNDIFSGLASGQGIRALQMQLGQIAQVLGGGGIRAAASTLGTALVGMINPINLAVVAFGLAASAAASYFFDSEDGAKKSKDAFEDHAAAVAALKEAYGKAAEGIEDFAARSKVLALGLSAIDASVLRLQQKITTTEFFKGGEEFDLSDLIIIDEGAVAARMRQLNDIIQEQAARSLEGLPIDEAAMKAARTELAQLQTLPGQIVAGFAKLNDELAIFQPALDALAESAKDGTGDFVAFQEAIAKIALGEVTDEQRKFGQELIKGAEAAAKNQRALDAITDAHQRLQHTIPESIALLRQMAEAMGGTFGEGILATIDLLIQKLGGVNGALSTIGGTLGNLMGSIGDTWTQFGTDMGAAANLIKKFESFSSKAYRDIRASTGAKDKFRVGFGSDTFVDEMGKIQKVTKDTVVTLAQAESDLARRTGQFQGTIVRQIGPDVWTNLLENQKAALTSLAYNYGSLPDSIVAALKKGDMGKVATAIAALPGGKGNILKARREEEARIFAGGSFAAEQALKNQNTAMDEWLAKSKEDLDLTNQKLDIQARFWTSQALRNAQMEEARLIQEGLTAATKQYGEVNDEMRAKIEAAAHAQAFAGVASAEAAEKMKQAAQAAKDQGSALEQMGQQIAQAFPGMISGALTGFIQDLRNGTDAAEALYNAISRIADQLLSMVIQGLVRQAFGAFLGGFSGGGFVPSPGGGLYATGGYTGDRSARAPAGIVHGQEFVINAQATRKHRDLLEAINRGAPGYASGGFVLPRISRMAAPAVNAAARTPDVHTRTSVINTFDAGSFLSEALSKPDGVNVILNVVRAQPGAFRTAMQG